MVPGADSRDGDVRYAADSGRVEQFNGQAWVPIVGRVPAQIRIFEPGGGGSVAYIVRPGMKWPNLSEKQIQDILANTEWRESGLRDEAQDDER